MPNDLHLHFTAFQTAVLVAGYLWWFSLGTTLALLAIALLTQNHKRRWLIAAALLPAFYLVLALGVASQFGFAELQGYRLRLAQAPLRKPAQLNGAWLPAGSRILWNSPARDSFSSIALPPGTSQIFGLPLTGSLSYDFDGDSASTQQYWQATLASPANVNGWTCAAGPLQLETNGALHRCTLQQERTIGGYTVPARSQVKSHALTTWIQLAAPMPFPELGTVLIPPGSVQFNEQGCIIAAKPPDAHPIFVHGVGLKYDVHWHYGARTGNACQDVDWIVGNLASDLRGRSERMEGLEVKVYPATGLVTPTRSIDRDPFGTGD